MTGGTAHVVADDAEALAVAAALAEEFRAEASARDAERRLPRAEVDRLASSGLLAVTVPAEYGGADVSQETLTEIFRLLAAADASLSQIPQSHFVYVNVVRRQGTGSQRAFFFAELLAGRRLGNAQSRRAPGTSRTSAPAWSPGRTVRTSSRASSTTPPGPSTPTGSPSWPAPRTTICTSPSSRGTHRASP